MKILAAMLASSIVGLGHAPEAWAEPPFVPRKCRGSAEKAGFEAGRGPGRAIAREEVEHAHVCERLDRVAERMMRKARRSPRGLRNNPRAICEYAGTVQGIYEALHGVWGRCSAYCCSEGKIVGEIGAELYCHLSIALDGLGVTDYLPRKPPSLCGAAFESCCESRFGEVTQSYADPEGQQCRTYTEGAYLSAWEQSLNDQCAYAIETPAITPDASPSSPQDPLDLR
ncbi:hypothetical protein [Polyangium jinanense]|uniref:Uncharacterized protein n=1 Tax=Polyangium jinanense TaxID=2829994 RepID=A0A9X3X105_9BACT|nr:hypothetical protein [Polyangium jinanense]MDC3953940.1 hypothetical protein [Polyangium jinanense]MDC3957847.1 hypothetical protein [Polyangium jinanense]MDC3978933.1 hypothetical protein [Polyangium jinanense]MDC3982104.1 hypothetical protein [Polyangium jinanense]